jgi:hypothetical protein
MTRPLADEFALDLAHVADPVGLAFPAVSRCDHDRRGSDRVARAVGGDARGPWSQNCRYPAAAWFARIHREESGPPRLIGRLGASCEIRGVDAKGLPRGELSRPAESARRPLLAQQRTSLSSGRSSRTSFASAISDLDARSYSRRTGPAKSGMRVTEHALIEEPIQCENYLVPILAVGRAQQTEMDQPVDKRFRQVDGNATRTSRRLRRDRCMPGRLPAPSSTRPLADTAGPPASSRRCAMRCASWTAVDIGELVKERKVCPRLKSMSASTLYDALVYDQRGEPIQRLQLFAGQISERQVLVHYPHWRFRIAAVHQALPRKSGKLST